MRKKRNELDKDEIRHLIKDYSVLTNKDLILKYEISKNQLRNIRLEYDLRRKDIVSLVIPKEEKSNFWGIMRNPVKILIVKSEKPPHILSFRHLIPDFDEHHFFIVRMSDEIGDRIDEFDENVIYNNIKGSSDLKYNIPFIL